MSETFTISSHLDATGLQCPLPLLKAKQALNKLASGQCLKVIATDPGSVRDFQAFADLSDHQLLSSAECEGHYEYVLQRA
jgi:TusA-related sulfurtransferase